MHERLTSDLEVIRYTARREPTKTPEELATAIDRYIAQQRRAGYSMWALEEKASDELIGMVGIYPVEWKGPDDEVAYLVARPHWGKGYAAEAARAAMRFGFAEVGLRRLVALILPENARSIRVAEKLGMRPAGRETRYGFECLVYEALA